MNPIENSIGVHDMGTFKFLLDDDEKLLAFVIIERAKPISHTIELYRSDYRSAAIFWSSVSWEVRPYTVV